jgi:4-hydroxybenzoate polyprenyltransferase
MRGHKKPRSANVPPSSLRRLSRLSHIDSDPASIPENLAASSKFPALTELADVQRVPAPLATPRHLPLAVDLDGTLIKTELLTESLLALVRRNVLFLFFIPFWALRGRAYLKHEIAKRVRLKVAALPYNEEFLGFLHQEYAQGRALILTTASDHRLATAFADHLGIFSDVLASNGKKNLKGAVKCKALRERYGDRGFDYAGDATGDVKVWAHSNASIVVNAPKSVVRKAEAIGRVSRVFARKGNTLSTLVRVLRIKHWIKNSLIFVPLVAAGEVEKLDLVVQAIYAFAAFSCVASSVYVINDLIDLTNDRLHHEKKRRPFASGDIPLSAGSYIVSVFLVLAISISMFLPAGFLLVLGTYFVLNFVYSLYLKQVLLLDVIVLAIFYSLRVVAGGIATGLLASNWLLVFSVFIFLSLAFAKRVSELQVLRDSHKKKCEGRGYLCTDLEQLANFGTASGYISVLVFALYLNTPNAQRVYTSSGLLWTVCPLLLYWFSRLWLLVHRHQIPEDPVVFVFQDKVSWVIGAAIAIVLVAAG